MKITVLTSSYPRFNGDGVGQFVKSLSVEIARLGHDVEVVAPYDREVQPMNSDGVHVNRFRYILPEKLHIMGHAKALKGDTRLRTLALIIIPFFLIRSFTTLLTTCLKQKSDIIHVHWVIPNGVAGALVSAILKIPLVITLHGSDVFLANSNPLFGFVARLVFKKADLITSCSPEMRKTAIKLGASKNCILMPWGVDKVKFSPQKKSDTYRAEAGWLPDQNIIIALGRLVQKKGFHVLIDAMPDVLADHPNTSFVIAGQGPLSGEFLSRARELGVENNLVLQGVIPWTQMPQLIANADVFILPSIRDSSGNVDGLPTVLLEAMSSGISVIASDIAGVSLVLDHGETGILIPPGDGKSLSRNIITLLNDSKYRIALGKAARKAVEREFQWSQIANRFSDLFNDLLWQAQNRPRLGTIYRAEMLRLRKLLPGDDLRILDVGCHNGTTLLTMEASLRVGVDLDPGTFHPHMHLVKADARYLPFANQSFDLILGLDLIEHVDEDELLINELHRKLSQEGRLILTTPSPLLRIFPNFLTAWVNSKWGHYNKTGYSEMEIEKLMEGKFIINLQEWNAPIYRSLYLPLVALHRVTPKLALNFSRQFAALDEKFRPGKYGFWIVVAEKVLPTHDNHQI